MNKYIVTLLAAIGFLVIKESWADGNQPIDEQNPPPWTKDFHGMLLIASDNIYRGIACAAHRPLVLALLSYNHSSGFYGGFLGLNTQVPGATFGMKPFVGIEKNIQHFLLGMEAVYWMFPKNTAPQTLNYFEIKPSAGYEFKNVITKAGIAYSPNFFFSSGPSYYPYVEVKVNLPYQFSIKGEVGHQTTQKKTWKIPNYTHFCFGVFNDLKAFLLGVEYSATNLSQQKCASLGGARDNCSSRLIFSVSRSF